MKKVILSISAMLFFGAAAIAQNTSAVVQVGSSDEAIVGQNGTLNSSTIGQAGNSNKSEVYQGIKPGAYPALNNKAEVSQQGNSNVAFSSQSNKNNKAYQTQKGNSNSATIWQDQIAGPATALNGGDTATQIQTGNNNKATIDQGTSGNELPVATPNGFTAADILNLAGVSVPFAPNGGNNAIQTQNGTWNLAYASQGGTGNESWQTQNSTAASSAEQKYFKTFSIWRR
jgi:hypothetical protein